MCLQGGTVIAAGAGSSETLQQVMGLLARRKQGEVAFTEKDYLSVLEGPLTSSGVLIHEAPDRLEKRTLKPRRESLVLQGSELTVRRGRHTYRLDLESYPQVAPYVEAVRATLAGNLAALEQVFHVTFTGNLAHWELGLVPSDRKAAREVRGIRIEGAQGDIRSVEIDKANGDRSVMTLGAPAGAPGR